MPKRSDIKKILVVGSGPIIIGQACEFDYSGSQACKALREEGYEVILVNSNPATIMTDPEMANVTYIEPLTPEVIERIIEKERPEALLPTLGGQVGLNIAAELSERGVLERYNVELIGAKFDAIRKAEDRILFKEAMERIGLRMPRSREAYSAEEAIRIADEIGYPVVVRPAYTLGGTGGGIAFNREELESIALRGIRWSRIGQVLIEQSVIGWKEYELEAMRDLADNVVIICSIENVDPMGVHTGDSITCAPAQTLTDREYQEMRDAAIKIMREVGVETGGSNIQFAVNPENPLEPDLTETHRLLELLRALDVRLVNISAGSPYYNPHIQRPAYFPPSDGYQPPEDPLAGVARQIRIAKELKPAHPDLVMVGTAYTYLQEFLPHVAQKTVELGWIDFVGLGRMVLPYPEMPSDCLIRGKLDRRRLCRTFSDCTTAPRNGLPSGCYPLDEFYKQTEYAAKLRKIKAADC